MNSWLLDNLQGVTLVQLRARRAQDISQRACHTPRAPDDLAQIGLGHFEFDDGFIAVFIFVDKNLALGLDDGLGNVLNHDARADARLNHLELLNWRVRERIKVRLGYGSGRSRCRES